MRGDIMKPTQKPSRFVAAFEAATKGLETLSVGAWPLDPCKECRGTGRSAPDTDCYACEGIGKLCECPGCSNEGDKESGARDEGSFSWSSCDACGSSLGGDRFAGHALVGPEKNIVHLNVCCDCLMFIANGDEPRPEDWGDESDDKEESEEGDE